MTTQADTRAALIQALINEGFFFIADLPKPVKVVRQAQVVRLRV